MVNNIIRVYHDEMAHCDVEKTIQGNGSNFLPKEFTLMSMIA